MAFASCLASSAMPLEQRYPRGLIDCRSSDLLNSFGAIIERTRQHFNPNYRLQGSSSANLSKNFLLNDLIDL